MAIYTNQQDAKRAQKLETKLGIVMRGLMERAVGLRAGCLALHSATDKTRCGRQQAAGSRQQAAGSRQQAAGSRQQAAGSRQQAAGVFVVYIACASRC
jgi:hypothetical protein